MAGTKTVFLSVMLSLVSLGRASAEPPRIVCEELRRAQLVKEAHLTVIDVRSSSDFSAAHIQNARSIPGAEVGTGELSHEGRIVVYCDDFPCTVSENAAEKLLGLGYSNVFVLDGGLGEWTRKGYPVVKGDAGTVGPKAESMSAEVAKGRIEAGTVLVLDVRTALEFAAGRLPGAKNVALERLHAEIPYLSKDKDILVYDRVASRSAAAAGKLLGAGFKVYELKGGLAGWVRMKYPLEVK